MASAWDMPEKIYNDFYWLLSHNPQVDQLFRGISNEIYFFGKIHEVTYKKFTKFDTRITKFGTKVFSVFKHEGIVQKIWKRCQMKEEKWSLM